MKKIKSASQFKATKKGLEAQFTFRGGLEEKFCIPYDVIGALNSATMDGPQTIPASTSWSVHQEKSTGKVLLILRYGNREVRLLQKREAANRMGLALVQNSAEKH